MRSLRTIPLQPARRALRGAAHLTRRAVGDNAATSFKLVNAKVAGERLDVPPTWLLAQARQGRIPHHRLGHYVRFDMEDLKEWLGENKIPPTANGRRQR